MISLTPKTAPADRPQRERALDPTRSILVQAPAGSGKTDLLTRRFLRLLAEVDDPREVVAITFTNAAAAEMRHRILTELEKAAGLAVPPSSEAFSMEVLADRALARSNALGWKLLDMPAQLRICTSRLSISCQLLSRHSSSASNASRSSKPAWSRASRERRAARR